MDLSFLQRYWNAETLRQWSLTIFVGSCKDLQRRDKHDRFHDLTERVCKRWCVILLLSSSFHFRCFLKALVAKTRCLNILVKSMFKCFGEDLMSPFFNSMDWVYSLPSFSFPENGRLLLNKCRCVSLLTETIEARPSFTEENIDPLTKEMADLVVLLTSGGMDKKVYFRCREDEVEKFKVL